LILRRTLLLLLLMPSLAAAQTSPEDQARGLLEDGRTYRKDGKLKQALDNFQTIVSGFPNTSFVDDALLEIGRYYLEVDRDVAKARDAFEQVTKRFPQRDGAPVAHY
jgi:outer membrane protein assembly factor BamD (BamD/ComL family)